MAELYVVGSLLLFAIAVLWILMPFAVFGTKTILSEILAETKRTNTLLSSLVAERTRAK